MNSDKASAGYGDGSKRDFIDAATVLNNPKKVTDDFNNDFMNMLNQGQAKASEARQTNEPRRELQS